MHERLPAFKSKLLLYEVPVTEHVDYLLLSLEGAAAIFDTTAFLVTQKYFIRTLYELIALKT